MKPNKTSSSGFTSGPVSRLSSSSRGPLGRALVQLVVALAMLCAITSVAFALSKDDLFKLKEQHVPDSVVLNVVKGSGPLNLTDADVKKLKELGAGDDLLKFLQDNGHILASTARKVKTLGGDPAPGDGVEPAPAETDPGAVAEEEARRKAEEEARIRAAAEELRKQDEEANARKADLERAMTKVSDGERMLERTRNMEAAKLFLSFLTLDPAEDTDGYYRAKCGLGKALFREKIYSGAAQPLLEVVMKGPEKPCFEEAFYMLRTLTQENGFAPPQLQDLTQFYVENLSVTFQDDFNYYLGKFFYDYHNLDLAFKYLDKVSKDSPQKAAALYLTGVAQIDPDVKKYRSAVENFQNAILTAERIDETDPQIQELAYMALARIAYEATNYDGALFYYGKVPKLSPRRSTALFESSWTFFLKNDYNRAVGAFHSLHSPFYQQWYYPDLYILEATVYLNLCRFGDSKEALAAFKKAYLDLQPLLEKYLNETTEPKAYYEGVVSIYNRRGTGEDLGLPMAFVQAILNDITFHNNHRYITNLAAEEVALRTNVAALGEFGTTVHDQVTSARENQIITAGIEVRDRLIKLNEDLTEWSIKADEIDFEIDGARAEEAKRKLINPDYVPKGPAQGTTLFVVADDWQYWPFEGEYWVDEIANYRSFLRSECIEE